MTPRFFALHGNEITLKYAHDDEPTLEDVRQMAHMLWHIHRECNDEVQRLENAVEARRRVEDETLP